MKLSIKRVLAVFGILVCTGVSVGCFCLHKNNQAYQKSIADKILRFHVIANSDSDVDQALKLKVRDGVLEYLQPYFETCDTKMECKDVIASKENDIKSRAEEILCQEGFDETVEVKLSNRYFPVKSYGEYTFPEGEYEALCVEIGEAKGKNWWCVLYPRLCFMDSMCAVVPDESGEVLRQTLTPEEYDSVFTDNSKEIVIKSKGYEWIKNIIKK